MSDSPKISRFFTGSVEPKQPRTFEFEKCTWRGPKVAQIRCSDSACFLCGPQVLVILLLLDIGMLQHPRSRRCKGMTIVRMRLEVVEQKLTRSLSELHVNPIKVKKTRPIIALLVRSRKARCKFKLELSDGMLSSRTFRLLVSVCICGSHSVTGAVGVVELDTVNGINAHCHLCNFNSIFGLEGEL